MRWAKTLWFGGTRRNATFARRRRMPAFFMNTGPKKNWWVSSFDDYRHPLLVAQLIASWRIWGAFFRELALLNLKCLSPVPYFKFESKSRANHSIENSPLAWRRHVIVERNIQKQPPSASTDDSSSRRQPKMVVRSWPKLESLRKKLNYCKNPKNKKNYDLSSF